MLAHAMRDGRIDGVFGDIALHPEIIVVAGFLHQLAALLFHLVGGLPGADQHFANAAHGLTVRGDDRERAHVVQNIFGGDGFLADAAFSEGHVFGDRGRQVVAHHQHVEMLGDGVFGVGPGWIGGGGDHVGQPRHPQNIGRMAATGAFGVKRVNGAALERSDGVFHKPALVERIGVDHHLHVEVVRDREAIVDGSRGGAPVLMQLEAGGTGQDHFRQWGRSRGIALAGQRQIHREGIEALDHALDVPGSRAGRGQRAMRRARAAAEHGGDAAHQGFFDLLGADKVNMGVHAASRQDLAFARNRLGRGADDDVDAGLGVRIARLADGSNSALHQPNVRFVDAGGVHDQGIGNDRIDGTLGPGALALSHAIPDDLATAEFDLFAIGGEILLHLDEQLGIGQSHLVTGGGAIHVGISSAGNPGGHENSG